MTSRNTHHYTTQDDIQTCIPCFLERSYFEKRTEKSFVSKWVIPSQSVYLRQAETHGKNTMIEKKEPFILALVERAQICEVQSGMSWVIVYTWRLKKIREENEFNNLFIFSKHTVKYLTKNPNSKILNEITNHHVKTPPFNIQLGNQPPCKNYNS